MWPYTADLPSIQDCVIPPCPTELYKGFWVFPMVEVQGKDGNKCVMADSCDSGPTSADEAYDFLFKNFLNHYGDNRAPFGVYAHATWFESNPSILEGYCRFVDKILKLGDVYVVSAKKGLDWIRNPVPRTGKLPKSWNDKSREYTCPITYYCEYESANQLPPGVPPSDMTSCSPCPPKYPWTDNPLGENTETKYVFWANVQSFLCCNHVSYPARKTPQSLNAAIKPGTCESNSCIIQDSGNATLYFAFPGDNTRFCTCINGKAYEMKCPSGNTWGMNAVGCHPALIYSHGNSELQEETKISSDDEPLPDQITAPKIQPVGENYEAVERRKLKLLTKLIPEIAPLPLLEPIILNIEPKSSGRKPLKFIFALITVASGLALLGCFSICTSSTLSHIYNRKR
ncbi:unnamed protein product [Allacma fusca]|uniref:Chitin-binding type-2 domain-containing protein n=1 Tax=Allacma fusca TaxID=39272 RepID=A0A8J2P9Y9_9HEXA|nr:unnamed protein product [Allacma fusca]